MIEIKDLYKDYKVKNNICKALKGVNISFLDNEFVCILGPSGCGKTTLLNIIGGLDRKTSGEFFVDNVDTKTFKASDWDSYRNHHIGFVFQNFNLIDHISILKNVQMALTLSGDNKKNSKLKAKEALDKVGLQGLYYKKPSQLSGGQMQRVAIARAIVNNPSVILADEPTGALDSETSIEIMNILKDLSDEHLVIMVTHNESLAEKYGDRIIRMLDGKVIYDEYITKCNIDEKVSKTYQKKKSFMGFFTSLSLSFKNLLSKYIRSIMTIFAGSIGIIGVTLVLSVSSGVTTYINKVQTETLYTSPVRITSSAVTTTEGTSQSKLERYPDEKIVVVTQNKTIYEGVNNIEGDFLSYIEKLDKDRYTIINYNRAITMNIYSENNGTYYRISTTYMKELVDEKDFLESQFDLIDGVYPTEANQIALVVDSYNCIPYQVFQSVGLDYEKGTYSTSDLIGKKYKAISNDNYYYKNDEGYYSRNSIANVYNNEGNIDLEICGVIRAKQTSSYSLYEGCFLYSSKLTDVIEESCTNSKIVIDQRIFGTSKDVLTGKPFEESGSSSYMETIEYQYNYRLISLGGEAKVTSVNIYSNSFEDRVYIESYIKSYEKFSEINIKYSDHMSSVSEDFATFIDILTKVLVIFALISLLVSAIMIAIITYISVIERTKEIGILRALGSRRIDITIVFCAETLLIGLGAGVLGIVFSYGFREWINNIVRSIIGDNFTNMKGLEITNFVQFDFKQLIIILIGSVLVTIISGLIPSISAAFKDPIKALKSE